LSAARSWWYEHAGLEDAIRILDRCLHTNVARFGRDLRLDSGDLALEGPPGYASTAMRNGVPDLELASPFPFTVKFAFIAPTGRSTKTICVPAVRYCPTSTLRNADSPRTAPDQLLRDDGFVLAMPALA